MTTQKIASWDQEFQVWHYSVSHSSLLLRFVPEQDDEQRIDVMFRAVQYMEIRPTYSSLKIFETDPEDIPEKLPELHSGGKGFLINESGDFVIAGRVSWHEDYGDHRSPSRFGPLPGTP